MIIPPTRDEPFFEPQPDGKIDIERLKITVRWATYLDSLASGVNTTTEVIDEADLDDSLLTEIQKTQSFTAELARSMQDLEDIGLLVGRLNARIAELEKKINNIDQFSEIV